jgi:Transcriptional regulators
VHMYSLAELTSQRLAQLVEAAEPGDLLGNKEDLRRTFEVSHGVMNEALRIAQSRGEVTIRRGPHGGVFAARPSPTVRLGNSVLSLDSDATSVSDALRLREALEPLVIADAARSLSADDIDVLRGCLADMNAAADDDDSIAFFHANLALHAKIAELGATGMLRSFYTGLLEIIREHTVQVSPTDAVIAGQHLRERYDLHAELVEAIASHDDDRVAAAIERHESTTFISAAEASRAS